MGKVIIDNIPYEVSDGACLDAICEQAGIPFSCNSGVCGTCQIEILEGAENLEDLNREESELGMDTHNRLGCQCRIRSGTVKITF
jgi:ferredoxin